MSEWMDSDSRRERRGAQRRRTQRRRRLAGVLALLALAVVVLVVVLAAGSGTSSRGGGAAKQAAAASAATGARGQPAAAGQGTGVPGDAAVPILMYHVIAPPPAGAPFPGLYVTPQEFAAQMQALRQAGWHAVTLDQLAANWRSGAPLGSGRPVVLTFDNGYHSQYAQALPVLQRLGWPADENIQLTGLPPSQGGLGEGEVRALVAAGWELDTQGISHADLIRLDASQLHEQVAGARETLERRYHVPVHWFCYPSGHYDATVVEAVKAAGYEGSTTVVPGWAHRSDDPYRLHRLRVLGGTSPQALLEQIDSSRSAAAAPETYSGA
jgi:peptidoglycan/xylan/chitin deacetylase (PgdA/CDA1 family)